MAADPTPVLTGVMRDQRRSLVLWSIALVAVCTVYIGVYPAIGGDEMAAMVEGLPEGMSTALGYDQMTSAAGYLASTVYGLLGPVLLLVFAIATGTRLVAGHEEDGTLELEYAAPVSRARLLLERTGALWVNIAVLVAVVTIATIALVTAFDLDVELANVLAGSAGLLLLVLGFGTVALAVGAATGRRAIGLGVAAALAVGAFVLDALGPMLDVSWMTAVSPFSWYLEERPLETGLDAGGLVLLAMVPVVATAGALARFTRRDLMV